MSNTITRFGNVTISGGYVHTGTISKSGGNYDIQGGLIAAGLAGTAGLTKSGAGTATLAGVNSYGGTTTVAGGALAVATAAFSAAILPGGTSVDFVSSTPEVGTSSILPGPLDWASLASTTVTAAGGSLPAGLTATVTNNPNLVVIVTSSSAYDSWASSYGLTGQDAAPAADPDNDGFLNNSEFAFGTSPIVGSPALLRTATSGGQCVISWLQRTDSSSAYTVQETADLVAGPWLSSVAQVQAGSGATPPTGYEWKQISVTATGKKFYRVRASL